MNISFAFWQVFSPFILGYAFSPWALWDGLLVGLIILVLAWYRMLRPTASVIPSWINVVLGAWLAISPFVLGFTPVFGALWNDLTIGIAVVVFSAVGLLNRFNPGS